MSSYATYFRPLLALLGKPLMTGDETAVAAG